MLYIASAEEFNKSVAQVNKFGTDLSAYMTCLSGEAQADLNATSELIRGNLEKTQAGVMADFERSKTQLEAARIKLQTQR